MTFCTITGGVILDYYLCVNINHLTVISFILFAVHLYVLFLLFILRNDEPHFCYIMSINY